MKNLLILICSFSLFLACKKKNENPPPEPEPEKRGTVSIQVQAYDSLGDLLTDAGNVRVRLNASNTVTTDASGKVSFPNMLYDTYLPELFREGWDAPPMAVYLSTPTQSLSIPIAQRSPFKLQNLVVNKIQKDTITISFNLDKPVPANKICKVAIVISSNAGLTGNNYEGADIMFLPANNISKFNLMSLANFNKFVNLIDSTKTFYVNALPVSYGEFKTNLLPKPILIGENLFAPSVVPLKKNWK